MHGLKVKLPGMVIAIFKTEDRYVVMKNACAHQGGDLSSTFLFHLDRMSSSDVLQLGTLKSSKV